MRIIGEVEHKILLLAAFLVGIVGIVFLKLQSYPIYLTISWPICVIIAYPVIMLAAKYRGLYEKIGDNCYYLGFVFTLTSLAVTLYFLYGSDNEGTPDQLPMRDVISGFGVALSSTIAGIVARVLMLRMAPDIAEQESQARVDFDLAVRDFRVHLRMSVGELRRYSVETSQILAEQRDAVREAMAQAAEAHKGAMDSSTAALTGFFEDTEKKLADHRAALQGSMEQDAHTYREAMREGAAAFREALDRISTALSGSEAQVRDALRRSVENQLQALEEGAADLRRILERTAEASAEYREEAARMAGLSRDTFGQTQESAEVARKELEVLKSLTEDIAMLSSKGRGLDAVLSGLAEKIYRIETGIAERLEPAVARVGESASVVSTTLADSSGKLETAAERFGKAAERTAAADMQTNIADAAERLETANKALSAAIEKLGELADKAAKPRRAGILGRIPGFRSR